MSTETPEVDVPAQADGSDLATEVRRLQLRLDALRRQLAERLETIRELREQGAGEQDPEYVSYWRERALTAEARYEALISTRTFRALQPARAVYQRLREKRSAARP